MKPYPDTWPKANPKRPSTLASRITEQEKIDLYQRKITTRELARRYETNEKYVSALFPGKEPIYNKKPLVEARKAFKLAVAKEVLEGKYTIRQAAKVAYVCYNTMLRCVAKAKIAYPELAEKFNKEKNNGTR